jgi:malonyl-ACP O-methyltransferase BioC
MEANKMNKSVVEKNFSKHASSYDQNTDVQQETSQMLVRMLPKSGVANILEIGCGTGGYTSLLKDAFKCAKIRAVDISGSMVRLARKKLNDERISFEVGDAEEISLGAGYDLITSNAAFHWLGDLEGIIKKTEHSLSKNGLLVFSSLGPMTFSELRASLGSAAGGKASIASDLFPEKVDIEKRLKKYFKNIKITERLIRESYGSLYELLKKIKYSGTRGRGTDIRKVWSPDLLKKIEDAYLARFGSIEATYQIFFCEAKKCP